MVRRPLLGTAVAVTVGIAAGWALPSPVAPLTTAALTCLALTCITRAPLAAHATWGLAGMLAASLVAPPGPGEHPLDPWIGVGPTTIAGRAVGPPRTRPDGSWEALIDVHHPAAGRLHLCGRSGAPPPPGAHVSARARLRSLEPAQIPGQRDRQVQGHRRGERARAYSAPAPAIAVARGQPATRDRVRRAARRFLVARLETPVRGLALALVLGDRGELDPDLAERFRRSGTAHLLAISGLHVGVVAVVLGGTVRRLSACWPGVRRRVPPRLIGLAAGVAAAALYGSLTGWAMSTRRAAAMAAAVAVALASGRRVDPLQVGAAAWCGLLLADPAALTEPATLLSFGSVAALVRLTPRMHGRPVLSLVAGSAAVALGTAPWTLSLFGQASLVSVPANALAIPLLGLLLVPLLLSSTALGLVWPAGGTAILAAADPVARAGCAALSVAGDPRWSPQLEVQPAGAATVISVVALFAALALPRRRARWAGAVFAALLATLPFRPGAPPPGMLTLTALDVGHGDALVLTFPTGETLLVDAGAANRGFDAGERLVVPALRRLGVSRVDLALVTHLHRDHYGGMGAVLRELDVGALFLPVPPSPEHGSAEVVAVASTQGTPVGILSAGAPLPRRIGPVRIELLHPRPGRPCPGGDRRCPPNDSSAILRIRYGDVALLLTGDAEVELERELLDRSAPLRSQVLKIPHHGSGRSSDPRFVAAVAPVLAIASLDPHNRHRFPRPSVWRRYRAAGATLLATGLHGTIQVSTDGRHLRHRRFTIPGGWSAWRSPATTRASPPRAGGRQ